MLNPYNESIFSLTNSNKKNIEPQVILSINEIHFNKVELFEASLLIEPRGVYITVEFDILPKDMYFKTIVNSESVIIEYYQMKFSAKPIYNEYRAGFYISDTQVNFFKLVKMPKTITNEYFVSKKYSIPPHLFNEYDTEYSIAKLMDFYNGLKNFSDIPYNNSTNRDKNTISIIFSYNTHKPLLDIQSLPNNTNYWFGYAHEQDIEYRDIMEFMRIDGFIDEIKARSIIIDKTILYVIGFYKIIDIKAKTNYLITLREKCRAIIGGTIFTDNGHISNILTKEKCKQSMDLETISSECKNIDPEYIKLIMGEFVIENSSNCLTITTIENMDIVYNDITNKDPYDENKHRVLYNYDIETSQILGYVNVTLPYVFMDKIINIKNEISFSMLNFIEDYYFDPATVGPIYISPTTIKYHGDKPIYINNVIIYSGVLEITGFITTYSFDSVPEKMIEKSEYKNNGIVSVDKNFEIRTKVDGYESVQVLTKIEKLWGSIKIDSASFYLGRNSVCITENEGLYIVSSKRNSIILNYSIKIKLGSILSVGLFNVIDIDMRGSPFDFITVSEYKSNPRSDSYIDNIYIFIESFSNISEQDFNMVMPIYIDMENIFSETISVDHRIQQADMYTSIVSITDYDIITIKNSKEETSLFNAFISSNFANDSLQTNSLYGQFKIVKNDLYDLTQLYEVDAPSSYNPVEYEMYFKTKAFNYKFFADIGIGNVNNQDYYNFYRNMINKPQIIVFYNDTPKKNSIRIMIDIKNVSYLYLIFAPIYIETNERSEINVFSLSVAGNPMAFKCINIIVDEKINNLIGVNIDVVFNYRDLYKNIFDSVVFGNNVSAQILGITEIHGGFTYLNSNGSTEVIKYPLLYMKCQRVNVKLGIFSFNKLIITGYKTSSIEFIQLAEHTGFYNSDEDMSIIISDLDKGTELRISGLVLLLNGSDIHKKLTTNIDLTNILLICLRFEYSSYSMRENSNFMLLRPEKVMDQYIRLSKFAKEFNTKQTEEEIMEILTNIISLNREIEEDHNNNYVNNRTNGRIYINKRLLKMGTLITINSSVMSNYNSTKSIFTSVYFNSPQDDYQVDTLMSIGTPVFEMKKYIDNYLQNLSLVNNIKTMTLSKYKRSTSLGDNKKNVYAMQFISGNIEITCNKFIISTEIQSLPTSAGCTKYIDQYYCTLAAPSGTINIYANECNKDENSNSTALIKTIGGSCSYVDIDYGTILVHNQEQFNKSEKANKNSIVCKNYFDERINTMQIDGSCKASQCTGKMNKLTMDFESNTVTCDIDMKNLVLYCVIPIVCIFVIVMIIITIVLALKAKNKKKTISKKLTDLVSKNKRSFNKRKAKIEKEAYRTKLEPVRQILSNTSSNETNNSLQPKLSVNSPLLNMIKKNQINNLYNYQDKLVVKQKLPTIMPLPNINTNLEKKDSVNLRRIINSTNNSFINPKVKLLLKPVPIVKIDQTKLVPALRPLEIINGKRKSSPASGTTFISDHNSTNTRHLLASNINLSNKKTVSSFKATTKHLF